MTTDTQSNYQLYRYTPSLSAAILFTILFFACSVLHLWKIIQQRTWYFIPLLVGAILETTGYVGRGISHSDTTAVGPFIVQALAILLAPAFFAASIYMVLGRTIVLVNAEHHSIIKPKWLTRVFVTGDVISFLVQSGGGGLMAANSASAIQTGQQLVVVGLAIQLVFFGFFVVIAGIFHHRLSRMPTEMVIRMDQDRSNVPSSSRKSWATVLWTLYAVSLLIFIRSVFRLIEYAGGNDGYLISHELFLYVFDALLMLCVLVVLVVHHPSHVVPGKEISKEIV